MKVLGRDLKFFLRLYSKGFLWHHSVVRIGVVRRRLEGWRLWKWLLGSFSVVGESILKFFEAFAQFQQA